MIEVNKWLCVKDGFKLFNIKHRGGEVDERELLGHRALLEAIAGAGEEEEQEGGGEEEGAQAQEGAEEGPKGAQAQEGAEEGGKEEEGPEGNLPLPPNATYWAQVWLRTDSHGNVILPFDLAYKIPPGGMEVKGGVIPKPKAKAKANAPEQGAQDAPQAQASPTSPRATPAGSSVTSPVRRLGEQLLQVIQQQKPAREHEGGRKKPRGGLEVESPKGRLCSKAKEWTLPAGHKQEPGTRLKWPLEVNKLVDLDKFADHLKYKEGLEEEAVNQNCLAIRKFYGLFDLPEDFCVAILQ